MSRHQEQPSSRRLVPNPNLGSGARVAQAAGQGDPTNTTTTQEVKVSVVTDTIRNGVDTEKMFATLDLIKVQPELARVQFRATNRWIDGSHNRSTIKDFYAAGGEDTTRSEEFEIDAGEPAILLGSDNGANPAEYLLHAPGCARRAATRFRCMVSNCPSPVCGVAFAPATRCRTWSATS
jgi:hypothetical protein